MKKTMLFAVMAVLVMCGVAFGEASFDEIQGLIKDHNYAAAELGLEGIIKNHPRSAKAYYAMSQAQAGLGNQAEAKKALDMATGLDPKLKFASSSNVDHLKEAVTPQTAKIDTIESHTFRNCLIVLVLLGGVGAFLFFRKKKEEPVKKDYVPFAPYTPQIKDEPNKPVSLSKPTYSPSPNYGNVTPPPRQYGNSYPTAPNNTTIINNSGSNNNGFVEGMVAGVVVDELLNSHHHHRYEEPVVEREYVREVEVVREPERQVSSWDEPKETKSSSWDDDDSVDNSW